MTSDGRKKASHAGIRVYIGYIYYSIAIAVQRRKVREREKRKGKFPAISQAFNQEMAVLKIHNLSS